MNNLEKAQSIFNKLNKDNIDSISREMKALVGNHDIFKIYFDVLSQLKINNFDNSDTWNYWVELLPIFNQNTNDQFKIDIANDSIEKFNSLKREKVDVSSYQIICCWFSCLLVVKFIDQYQYSQILHSVIKSNHLQLSDVVSIIYFSLKISGKTIDDKEYPLTNCWFLFNFLKMKMPKCLQTLQLKIIDLFDIRNFEWDENYSIAKMKSKNQIQKEENCEDKNSNNSIHSNDQIQSQKVDSINKDYTIQKYLDKMSRIQNSILNFLDNDDDNEVSFQELSNLFSDEKICDEKQDIRSVLHLLTIIFNNHFRSPNMNSKILKILEYFKTDIKKYFLNSELFNIFKENKRLLLFLVEEQMIKFDEYVVKKIISSKKYLIKKYPDYFIPEITPFIKEKWFKDILQSDKCNSEMNEKLNDELDDDDAINDKFTYETFDRLRTRSDDDIGYYTLTDKIECNMNDFLNINEIPDNFNELRKEGENDNYICKLIREDLVTDFITYVNKKNYSLNSQINQSIYETNSFLLKNKNPSLIEYSAFYGSIQIFTYLKLNQVELTPSLWFYAIHSQNAEIIHILEDDHIDPNKEKSYLQCLKEAIKTHSNDICNYFLNNYFNDDEEEKVKDILMNCFKYYNFAFIQNNYINQSSFNLLCQYDYYLFVKKLLEIDEIDVNSLKDSQSPLFDAVDKENIDIVRLLLSCPKINVNLGYKLETEIEDYYRFNKIKINNIEATPLFKAIENENLEISKLLLSMPNINVNLGYKKMSNETEIYNKTALYVAISRENIQIVQLLVSCPNIDINLHNKVKKILEYKEFKKEKFADLIEIEKVKDTSLLEYEKEYYEWYSGIFSAGEFYEYNTKFDEINNITALCFAILKGNIKIVKILLTCANLDINDKHIILRDWINYDPYIIRKIEKTPLCLAVEKGNIEMIQLLLSNEKLNINDLNIIIKAKNKYDQYRAETKLLRRYDEERKSTLSVAIENKKDEIVQLLLKNKKIDVNQKTYSLKSWKYISIGIDLPYEEKMKNEKEFSPLYLSLKKGSIKIFKLLLSKEGIDLNCINKFTEIKIKRPLNYYDFIGERRYVSGIINYYLYNETNITVLQFAIFNNFIGIIKLLLSKEKLDVNVLYTKIKEIRTYSNSKDSYGKFNLPCNDFDIKIPDMKIRDSTLNDVEHSIFLSLSNPNRIRGKLDINHYKVEKPPLIISIENKNDEITQLLLSNNHIKINIPQIAEDKSQSFENGKLNRNVNVQKKSPLHVAVISNSINIIRYLLKNKRININAKDENGKTPIEYTNDEQVIKLLKQ